MLERWNDKIIRCANPYCRRVLGKYHLKNNRSYCDKWCADLVATERSIKRVCKHCGSPDVKPLYNKKGYACNWTTTCPDCQQKRKDTAILNRKKRLEKKKHPRQHTYNIDINGHTCKMCGKYKTLDMFSKNNKESKGINYRCKQCCQVSHKMYYHRNRAKINEYQKLYHRRKLLTKEAQYDTMGVC